MDPQKVQEAFNRIVNVCRASQGTAEYHEELRRCIELVAEAARAGLQPFAKEPGAAAPEATPAEAPEATEKPSEPSPN